jgi:hypothetical protein
MMESSFFYMTKDKCQINELRFLTAATSIDRLSELELFVVLQLVERIEPVKEAVCEGTSLQL